MHRTARVSAIALATVLCGCAGSTRAPATAGGSGEASELGELLRARSSAPSGWIRYPGRGFTFKAPADLVPDGLGMFDPNSPMTLGGLKGSVRIIWEIGPADATRHPGADSEPRRGFVSAQISGRRVWVHDETPLSGEVSAYFQPDAAGYALTLVIAAPDIDGDELRDVAADIIRSVRFASGKS